MVVLGASTGGTEAIKTLLSRVPSDWPPVAIVQHMPEGFTESFAARLDEFSALQVTEAVDGDALLPGHAFLARGGVQMTVQASGAEWRLRYGTDELVNRHWALPLEAPSPTPSPAPRAGRSSASC